MVSCKEGDELASRVVDGISPQQKTHFEVIERVSMGRRVQEGKENQPPDVRLDKFEEYKLC